MFLYLFKHVLLTVIEAVGHQKGVSNNKQSPAYHVIPADLELDRERFQSDFRVDHRKDYDPYDHEYNCFHVEEL